MIELKILLQDMDKLEVELHPFEIKFGVKSADFYQTITRGELEDFDALDEYRSEFIQGWPSTRPGSVWKPNIGN